MPFDGGCLCGAIRYELLSERVLAVHCYCQMCRKAHGTAYSTHFVCPPEDLRWTQGESGLVQYESSPDAYREFCRECGTHLLVHGQTGDGNLALPVGTLDGDPEVTILTHIFTSELVSWHEINDELPQHDQWPPGFGPEAKSG